MKFSLEKLLNLSEIKVTGCHEIEGNGLIIEIEPTLGEAVCPRCGKVSKNLHQNHRHYVRDLPISSIDVLLRVNRRQFKCYGCQKPFSEDLTYVEKGRKYTKRLALEIVKQVTSNNIASVAKKNDLTEEEVESMLGATVLDYAKSVG